MKPTPTLKLTRQADYVDKLVSSLSAMRKAGTQTDFRISVNGHIIQCHKCVLTAASNYFECLFRSNMKESKEGQVCMDTIDKGAPLACECTPHRCLGCQWQCARTNLPPAGGKGGWGSLAALIE